MVRIGLLGVGHLGRIHLENWQQIEEAEVVGFFDPNEETAVAIAEKYKIKKFETAEKLIAACDAVDIVSPTVYHHDLCALALRAGKHVPSTNASFFAKPRPYDAARSAASGSP